MLPELHSSPTKIELNYQLKSKPPARLGRCYSHDISIPPTEDLQQTVGEQQAERELCHFQVNKDFHLLQPITSTIALLWARRA